MPLIVDTLKPSLIMTEGHEPRHMRGVLSQRPVGF